MHLSNANPFSACSKSHSGELYTWGIGSSQDPQLCFRDLGSCLQLALIPMSCQSRYNFSTANSTPSYVPTIRFCFFVYVNFHLWLFGSCVGCVCGLTWEELKLRFSTERGKCCAYDAKICMTSSLRQKCRKRAWHSEFCIS